MEKEAPDVWFGRYGQDAQDAWNDYEKTGDPEKICRVIRSRIDGTSRQLVKQLYTFALVFAEK